MRQTVTIKQLLADGRCEVWVRRSSACGDSCASCGMNGACASVVVAEAENAAGGKSGDTVLVESGTGAINGAAALVYLIPALLAILGGALAEPLGYTIIGAAAGLLLGIGAAWLYGRRRRTLLRVVEIVHAA